MNPIYVPNYHPFPSAVMSKLLELEWLEVTDARREYFMSDVPRSYIYGKGVGQREYQSNPYTSIVGEILDELNHTWYAPAGDEKDEGDDDNKYRPGKYRTVKEKLVRQYNVCFLNRYDHQRHQLGWHADDSPTMDRNHPIAVISFGAEREIWWKPQAEKGVTPLNQRQLLQDGSLFVMPGGFQDTHFHRIPKCDRACGIRISLTFRRYL